MKAKSGGEPAEAAGNFGVGHVAAVPRQQVVRAMDCGNGNVKRVFECLSRDQPLFDEAPRDVSDIGGDLENCDSLEFGKPPGSGSAVTRPGFPNDALRREQPEAVAAQIPPFDCQPLVCGYDDVAAWSGREIARNCGFDVDPS